MKRILENLWNDVPNVVGMNIVKKESERNPTLPPNESKLWVKGIGDCVSWLPADVNINPTKIISFPGSENSFIRYLILQATGMCISTFQASVKGKPIPPAKLYPGWVQFAYNLCRP